MAGGPWDIGASDVARAAADKPFDVIVVGGGSAGMTSAGVLVGPENASLDTGKRQTVLVERAEGRYEPRDVQVGRRAGGYVEVLGGVAKGEKVVVGANFLIDAESNLQAALKAFTNGNGPAAEAKP